MTDSNQQAGNNAYAAGQHVAADAEAAAGAPSDAAGQHVDVTVGETETAETTADETPTTEASNFSRLLEEAKGEGRS